MKKVYLPMFFFLLFFGLIGLSACKQKHTHLYVQKAVAPTCTEKGYSIFTCSCGESYTDYIVDPKGHNYAAATINSTCMEQGCTTYTCVNCGDTYFENIEAKGHEFLNYVSDNNATCTQDGTKTAVCNHLGCHETDTVIDVGTGQHKPSTTIVENKVEPTMINDGGYDNVVYCKSCNEELSRDHITIDKTIKNTEVYFKTLSSALENEVCNIKLPNDTLIFDFNNDIVVADNASYELYNDSACQERISTKIVSLETGDNVYYLVVKNDIDVTTYIITLRVRPIYTITFDTNGGSSVESQMVEEDFFIVAPITTKTGYKFKFWDYNFENAITENKIITASWEADNYTIVYDLDGGTNALQNPKTYTIENEIILMSPTKEGYTFVGWSNDGKIEKGSIGDITFIANWKAYTDTPYIVEYYFENINNLDYTLNEMLTERLAGITDTTANAEIKTYEHFSYNSSKSKISGNIDGDGSQVLKVYYTRNEYLLFNENATYGKITNGGTYKYGTEQQAEAIEYMGCEFVGWYNGNQLLSLDKIYTFTMDKNVTAKFRSIDNMLEPFNVFLILPIV